MYLSTALFNMIFRIVLSIPVKDVKLCGIGRSYKDVVAALFQGHGVWEDITKWRRQLLMYCLCERGNSAQE